MPRTILILSSTPRDMAPLRVHEEVREIEDAIRRARYRDEYQVVVRLGLRARDMHRALLDHRPAIVHFSGHGHGELGVVLEDDSGDSLIVSSSHLAHILGLFAHDIECVLLNACHSQAQVEAIARHIPFVVGMSQVLHDRAAVTFASAFYEALANGNSVPFAHELACSAVSVNGLGLEHVAVLMRAACPQKQQPACAHAAPAGRTMGPWRRRLGLALSPLVLLALMVWLGAAVHDARLALIGLSGAELHYSGAELLMTGLGASARMLWYALAGPLAGVGIEGWSVWPLVALSAGAVALMRFGRPRACIGGLLVLLPVLAFGLLFHAQAAGVHHVAMGESIHGACTPGVTLPQQIRFEVCSWLRNPAAVNAGRRMALASLGVWLAITLAAAMWLAARAARHIASNRRWRRAATGVAAMYGLLFAAALAQLPRVHAVAHWGLKYPGVIELDRRCGSRELIDAIERATCRAVDVSEGARSEALVIWGDEHTDAMAPAGACPTVPGAAPHAARLVRLSPAAISAGTRCILQTRGMQTIFNRGD